MCACPAPLRALFDLTCGLQVKAAQARAVEELRSVEAERAALEKELQDLNEQERVLGEEEEECVALNITSLISLIAVPSQVLARLQRVSDGGRRPQSPFGVHRDSFSE